LVDGNDVLIEIHQRLTAHRWRLPVEKLTGLRVHRRKQAAPLLPAGPSFGGRLLAGGGPSIGHRRTKLVGQFV
jgi:hypothetical protein